MRHRPGPDITPQKGRGHHSLSSSTGNLTGALARRQQPAGGQSSALGESSARGESSGAGDGPPATIPAALARAADRWPDAEALAEPGLQLTFGEELAWVREYARAMMASGAQAGDRVAIWAPNSIAWVLAAYGAYAAGCVLVPVNTRFKAGEAEPVLRRSGARLLFTVPEFRGNRYLDMALRMDLPGLAVVTLSGGEQPGAVPLAGFLSRAAEVPAARQAERESAIRGGDSATVLFTSGTTGRPKAVMLGHQASVRAFRDYGRTLGFRPGDRQLGIPPFFHGFGLHGCLLTSLLAGATVLPVPVFDAAAVASLIERERVTVLSGPPTVYLGLLECAATDPGLFRSLRLGIVGATSFSRADFAAARDGLGLEVIASGYGLTEATTFVSTTSDTDDFETVATTSGRPGAGIEVRIADDDGRDCPGGADGQILVRGYTVMQGYLDDDIGDTVDADGWLRTGDIGHLDAAGRIVVVDRKKDMFIVGGFNAYPTEIEQLLTTREDIVEAAVIGVPDQRLGEVGKAFVVPRAGALIDPAEVIAWCRENMANYKVPRSVQVIAALPRNTTGKVLKYELRAAESARRAADERP
jgi:HIP---CoA ligase